MITDIFTTFWRSKLSFGKQTFDMTLPIRTRTVRQFTNDTSEWNNLLTQEEMFTKMFYLRSALSAYCVVSVRG